MRRRPPLSLRRIRSVGCDLANHVLVGVTLGFEMGAGFCGWQEVRNEEGSLLTFLDLTLAEDFLQSRIDLRDDGILHFGVVEEEEFLVESEVLCVVQRHAG